MNSLILSSLFWATFNSLYLPVVNAAPDDREKIVEAHEPRAVQIQSDTVVTQDDSEHAMHAPDAPTPPAAPRASSIPPAPPIPPMPDIDAIVSASLSEAFAGSPLHMGDRAIKNAPYSAEVISERVQLLADGNQIVKRVSQTSYRDSAGRTRTEISDANGAVRSVKIFDAIDGVSYNVNPSAKSATKIAIDPNLRKHIQDVADKAVAAAEIAAKSAIATTANAKTVAEQSAQMAQVGKEARANVIESGKPERRVSIHRMETRSDGNSVRSSEDIKIRVLQSDDAESLALATGSPHMMISANQRSFSSGDLSENSGAIMSGPLGISFRDRAWSSKATTKQLGFRDFNGVRAEGKMRAYIIPAGEIGNQKAITVSTETWTSPELQITVYSKHSDPRVGENIYRLGKISRNEQPMSLFTVPDGYTLKVARMPSISVKPE